MNAVQRIMIRTEIAWEYHVSDSLLKHPTQRLAIDNAGMDAKSDDATAGVIHQRSGTVLLLMAMNHCRRAVRSMPGDDSDVAGVIIDNHKEVIARCSNLSRECNLPLSAHEVRGGFIVVF